MSAPAAIQLICEEKSPSAAAMQEFNRMAAQDASAVVRLYLASALQRINFDDRWSIAQALMAHAEDAQDHNLPKMIWYGFEPLVAKNADRALAMASEGKIPMITRYIARRSVDANAIETLIAHIGKKSESPVILLEGMLDGLEGRKDIVTPKNWEAIMLHCDHPKKTELSNLRWASRNSLEILRRRTSSWRRSWTTVYLLNKE